MRIGRVTRSASALGLLLCAMSTSAEVYRFGAQDVIAILQAGGVGPHLSRAAKPGAEPGAKVVPAPPSTSSVRIVEVPVDRAEEFRPDASGVVQLAPADVLGQFPAVLGIVPDAGVPKGTALQPAAVFAVSSASQDSMSVRLEPGAGEAFRIAATDRDGLAEWLGARSTDFFAGNVVLQRVDGLDGALQVLFGTEPAISGEPQPVDKLREGLGGLVGRSLADVSFAALDGRTLRFGDLSESVLLVHVWATWCAPCIADMPILEALDVAHAGLRVVNLSDEPADVIETWLADNPTEMLHGRHDDFAFLVGYDAVPGDGPVATVRPVHLVLDPEAVVLEADTGGVKGSGAREHLAEMVEPYL